MEHVTTWYDLVIPFLASRSCLGLTAGSIMVRRHSTRDGDGVILKDGDSVTLIKDLKVKGASTTLKRGTWVTNIRLTGDVEEIECSADKVKGLVLKTASLKKA